MYIVKRKYFFFSKILKEKKFKELLSIINYEIDLENFSLIVLYICWLLK